VLTLQVITDSVIELDEAALGFWCAYVALAPNARCQPRREAGAERTLYGVGCTPWFGAGSGTDTRISLLPLIESRTDNRLRP
jgi:hypothetical protein